MNFKRQRWRVEKRFVNLKLSELWRTVEDESDSIQITIQKVQYSDNIYDIIMDYFEKE